MSGTYSQRTILEVETVGSFIEAAAGLGVVVLAIIGLAGAGSLFMTSIACVLLGAALLAQGGTIAAEYSKLLGMITGGTFGSIELGGGMTVELLAGGSAVVLGILGLLAVNPEILIPAAVIGVGASLMLSSTGLQRLNTLKGQAAGLSEIAQRVAQATVAAAIAAQVLAGGAAIVLGILALTMATYATTLTLIGLLILGAAVGISSAALTGRMLGSFTSQSGMKSGA